MSRRQPNTSRPFVLVTKRSARIRSVKKTPLNTPLRSFLFLLVPYLYYQAAVGDTTEVAGRPRAAAVSDGELQFQQELLQTQNEIKVSSQPIFQLVTERKLCFTYLQSRQCPHLDWLRYKCKLPFCTQSKTP